MYTIIWRFTVKPAQADTFATAYGPAGAWAKLFRKHAAYKGTELFRDTTRANVFLTLDHWTRNGAFEDFKAQHHDAYEALDREFEGMTEKEEKIGVIST